MAPPLLALRGVELTFGATPLLTGADIAIGEGERLCLVGRNGSGKSTLMKIAAGLIESDKGERFLQPGTTIRYLPQEPDLTGFANIGDYVRSGLEEGDDPWRATLLMEGLGLDPAMSTANLSGGEARRAAIAHTLAPEPDILLLDEPTNHLDLPAIEWLEEQLRALRSAIVMISHDRRFLQNLTRATLWVDRGKTRLLKQGFTAFEDWRDKVLEEEELEAHKLGRKIVREEHWVTHGVSGRRKRNVRRLDELAALRKKHSERRVGSGIAALEASDAEQSGKLVIRAEKISKSYGAEKLVDRFSTRVARGERLAFVGGNGTGKTTLIRLLTGELQPDEGTVVHGSNIEMLVVDQKRDALYDGLTVRDALTGGGTDIVRIGDTGKHVLAYMKDFLFLPEQAGTPVEALSGGERGRLVLAMRLRNPSNLLVLDEPTNDLDLETLDLLQEVIADYAGTVLLVSHDRDFIDRICTMTLAPDGKGKWVSYAGGWSDMLAQGGRLLRKRDGAAPRSTTEIAPAKKVASTQQKTLRHKLSFKDQHALDTLPAKIAELEKRIGQLNDKLAEPGLYEQDPVRFDKFVKELARMETEHSQSEELWLELEMKREELAAQ